MFGISTRGSLFRHWRKKRLYVPELGERHTLCNWVLNEDDYPGPMVEFQRYGELLSLLPDKIVQNLERARLSRDGRVPMLKAGLGYEELLASVIVDGAAVHDSSTENILFPDLMIPANYMQPGGIPGRTLHWKARGRITTLSTAATLIVNIGHAATAATTVTTTWAKTGAVVMDAAVHTNEQWFCEGTAVVRSVGSAGTVFAQGDMTCAAAAYTTANNVLLFMGSAGSAAPAAATMDMTINEFLILSAKWSLTTAYSITGHIYILEALN
jgi:hypothetical protein